MPGAPLKKILTLALLAAVSAAAADIDIIEGNPHAAVKVTIFSDLQCDYCATFRAMLDNQLLPKYGKDVAFVHRDLPLGRHNWARAAAMAARWVYAQNSHLGIVFRRELLAEQSHITPESLKPWVAEFAGRYRLSQAGITASLTDPQLGAMVDADARLAEARGIRKVPTVIVAGQSFSETIIYDDIARLLDLALPH